MTRRPFLRVTKPMLDRMVELAEVDLSYAAIGKVIGLDFDLEPPPTKGQVKHALKYHAGYRREERFVGATEQMRAA